MRHNEPTEVQLGSEMPMSISASISVLFYTLCTILYLAKGIKGIEGRVTSRKKESKYIRIMKGTVYVLMALDGRSPSGNFQSFKDSRCCALGSRNVRSNIIRNLDMRCR